MKKPVLDIHMHTIASGHAYGTIREMAYAAKEKGLKLIGITEHSPGIPGTVQPIYFKNVGLIPRDLYGVEIFNGSEINVLNGGKLALEQVCIDCLDYAIVGIHHYCYENEDRERNTDNVIECMKNEKVHFVSHPDDDKTPLNYKRLVEAAKEYQVALEVNNSSLLKPTRRLNCIENYKTMLTLCREWRVPIVLSSDAHDPSVVGEVSLAVKMAEEMGLDDELIINTSTDRFKEFIGFAK